jgi:hypothetical protein
MNAMAQRALLTGSALLFACAASCTDEVLFADEPAAWQPENTRVFIVSLTRFKGDRLHSFTTDDRLDDAFAELFQERGVPASQIVLLKDEQASTQNVQSKFASLLRNSKPDETLFFYFGSHGGYDPETGNFSFCAFNANLSFRWVLDAIENDFQGSQALLLTDCCYSGGMVELAKKRDTSIAYACLSSTYAHQTAWSGWRYMQCLIRAFAGDPVVDLDGNGQVELGELAAYTARYMAFAAEGKPMFTTTGDFDPKLSLADSKGKKRARIGELLEAWSGTNWSKAEILDARGQQFKIHFTADTRSKNDVWVSSDDLRRFEFARFPIGTAVDVQDSSDRQWHSAKVLKTWESLHLCRNDDRSSAYDEWFGPSRIRISPAGAWSGKWRNDLGESGPESLALQAEGELFFGTWSGDVKLKGERLGKDTFYFEGTTLDRSYRCAGRMEGAQLVLDYCAHRARGDGKYFGWSTLLKQGAVAEAVRDPREEFSGNWTGSYENSAGGSGTETLELTENAEGLKGVWSGVEVTGERLGNASFYLQGKLGQRNYRVLGRVAKGQLVLNYSATTANERYTGWSTLAR